MNQIYIQEICINTLEHEDQTDQDDQPPFTAEIISFSTTFTIIYILSKDVGARREGGGVIAILE